MNFCSKYPFINAARLFSQKSNIHQTLIERYTEISTTHLTPEIKLNLIPNEIGSEENIAIADPFWGFYWPGGQGLARYILDNPSIAKGKRVLDFGCGSGALAIAALRAGAARAVANDIDPGTAFRNIFLNSNLLANSSLSCTSIFDPECSTERCQSGSEQ